MAAAIDDRVPRARVRKRLGREGPAKRSTSQVLRDSVTRDTPAAAIDRARCVLERTTLLRLDEPVVRLAEHVGPPVLRSRDAIPLASALSIGDVPEAFITYDDRLAAAAKTLNLRVIQPER